MDDTMDAQGTAIVGAGVVVLLLLLYESFVSPTILGYEAFSLALWVFAFTFVAVALLHGAYGRGDLATAHGAAAIGWFLILLGSTAVQVALGLLVLLGACAYIAFVTIRERREDASAPS